MTTSVMKKSLLAISAAMVLVAYTRVVWLSGFDQGVNVAFCVTASFQNGGKLAASHPACVDAKAYKHNPLWLMRRRGAS